MIHKQFGRWTVTGDAVVTERGERKWLCRCACGTERYVLERSLKSGGSASCGCLRREKTAEKISQDLTGRVFGELTVLERAERQRKNGGIWWKCICSCGQTYECPGTLLLTGKRTRCSSREHEKNYAFCDISGERFGRLVAQYPTGRCGNSGSVIWHCQCDCGNEVDVSYNNLRYTDQKSCGCQKKEHDRKLKSYLTHVAGTSVDMLKSKKVPMDNTTGYKGVYLIHGKYVAKIVFQKKQYFLGTYDNIEDAAQARKEAEEVLFDGVAEHYRKWKERAAADPEWARENAIEVLVSKNDDKRLSVTLLPAL